MSAPADWRCDWVPGQMELPGTEAGQGDLFDATDESIAQPSPERIES